MADDGRLTRLIRFIADKASLEGVKSDAKRALDEGTKPPERNFSRIRSGLEKIRGTVLRLGAAMVAAFSVVALTRFVRSSIDAARDFTRAQLQVRNAIQNVGVAWETASGQVSAYARALWDTHRLTEGEVYPILQQLVQVTGDYAASLRNVGLAADIAAATGMDAASAARLLGRVMRGDTGALKRYGIEIADGADALAVLTERFQGAAKAATDPFATASKAWGDFKEAIGLALLGADDFSSGMDRVAVAVRAATDWVHRNQAAFAAFSSGILRVVRVFAGAVDHMRRGAQRLGAILAVLWDGIPLRLEIVVRRATLRILDMFDKLRAPLRAMGIDAGESFSANMRAGMERGIRSSEQALDHLRVAFVQTLDEIDGRVERTRANLAQGLPDLGPGLDQMVQQGGGVVEVSIRPTIEPVIGKLAVPGRDSGLISTMLPSVENTRQTFDVLTDIMRERLDVWASVAQTAAGNFSAAWEDAFTLLMRDMGSLADFGEKVARGLAAGFLGALAQYAQSKVAENIALAAENAAKGLAASVTPGMQAAAAGFYGAAKGNIGAAALWGVLAGGSGGASNAVGGSGSAPAGGTVAASRVDPFAQGGRGEVHVYIDAFDPSNPVHYKAVGQAVRNVAQTSGRDVIVHRGRQR